MDEFYYSQILKLSEIQNFEITPGVLLPSVNT